RSRTCVWTRGLETIELPVAHGEGKFVPANDAVRRALWESDQVALIYAQADGSPTGGRFPENPNGSVDDIAGVCDPTGLVLGLMPHPEDHVHPQQHPRRARDAGGGLALALFANGVRHARLP